MGGGRRRRSSTRVLSPPWLSAALDRVCITPSLEKRARRCSGSWKQSPSSRRAIGRPCASVKSWVSRVGAVDRGARPACQDSPPRCCRPYPQVTPPPSPRYFTHPTPIHTHTLLYTTHTHPSSRDLQVTPQVTPPPPPPHTATPHSLPHPTSPPHTHAHKHTRTSRYSSEEQEPLLRAAYANCLHAVASALPLVETLAFPALGCGGLR